MLINFRVTQVFHLNHRDVTANENSARPRMTFSRRLRPGRLGGGMFTWRLLVREEESHLRRKLLFNSKERSLTTFFNARIWIYIVFQAAEHSHRPPELLITCNIKGPICCRNFFQCNLTSGCIHRGGSLLDLVLNNVGAGTKYITEKPKHRWLNARLPVRSLDFCTSEPTLESDFEPFGGCGHSRRWPTFHSSLNTSGWVRCAAFTLRKCISSRKHRCFYTVQQLLSYYCFFCLFPFLASITNPESEI